jgi:hypothetical protein
MNISGKGRGALTLCAAALLASCGGAPQLDGGGLLPQGATARTARQAIAPAKGQTLLYVSDLGANAVLVFPYPKGAQTQKLIGFGSVAGLCSNQGGDVFVVDEAGPVDVFAHGGTSPIRQLATAGAPDGCAVDPTTGNLAVTNMSSYLHGVVSIYPGAKGKGKIYRNKSVDATFFCGYDPSGNLFLDGWDRYGKIILLELPKGKSAFTIWHPKMSIKTLGGVQWDGKYVAVADQGGGVVYRTRNGSVVQTVKLRSGTAIDQFWIAGGTTLIGPNAQAGGSVGFWHYPGGGAPYQTLGGFYYPVGVALSRPSGT